MATKIKQEMIGGPAMKTNIASLPPEAWENLAGDDDVKRLYSLVAWMYACADKRATKEQSIPWSLSRGDTELIDNETRKNPALQWFIDMYPALINKTVFSTLANGKAYWRIMEDDTIKWMAPSTITPEYNFQTGELTGFKRSANGKQTKLEVDEVIYFWPPDPDVENGPAKTFPGMACGLNANTLHQMDKFLAGYFERGMLKATILTYNEYIDPEQGKLVKQWWDRVFRGVKNAFSTMVLRGDFEPKVIGEGIGDLRDDALTVSERRSVEVAFGLPETKLNQAANLATKRADDVQFIVEVCAPHLDWVFSVINEQLLSQLGLSIQSHPNRMEEMQAEENEKAQSFAIYVNAGVPPETAVAMLGIEVPEQMPLSPIAEGDGMVKQANVLNGAQIQSALTIIQSFNDGLIDREIAVRMITTFFNLPQEVAERIVPAGVNEELSPRVIAEEAALRRWANKRTNPDPAKFHSDVLSFDRISEVISEVKGWEPQQSDKDQMFYDAVAEFKAAMRYDATKQEPINLSITNEPMVESSQLTQLNDSVMAMKKELEEMQIVVNVPETPVSVTSGDVVVNVPETAVNIENNVEMPKRATEKTIIQRDNIGRIESAESVTEFDND